MAVKAARIRATLGEISDAIEKVSGRYKAVTRTISGVYSSEYNGSEKEMLNDARKLTNEFAENEGRRPRNTDSKNWPGRSRPGAKVVATAYADMGFDVDVGPLFQTPEETAKQAVENDVHVVGMSSLAAGHKTLLPQLIEELKNWHGKI